MIVKGVNASSTNIPTEHPADVPATRSLESPSRRKLMQVKVFAGRKRRHVR